MGGAVSRKLPKVLVAIVIAAPLALSLSSCGKLGPAPAAAPPPPPPPPPPPVPTETHARPPSHQVSTQTASQETRPPSPPPSGGHSGQGTQTTDADQTQTDSTGGATAAPSSTGFNGTGDPSQPVGTSTAAASASAAQNYLARVKVDRTTFHLPGDTGELDVYVGPRAFVGAVHAAAGGTVSQAANLGAFGPYAKVSPHGTGFTFTSLNPGDCFHVDQGGSVFPYKMTPDPADTAGTYQVGASVLLYDQPDCTGTPVSKPTADITVTVTVESAVHKGFGQILSITWQGFLKFWYGFVALVFGLILFLIRKKFYKWFGYKQEKDEKDAGDDKQ